MSSNYDPRFTSQSAGETLYGTLLSDDRASGPEIPEPVTPPQSAPQSLPDYLTTLATATGSAADRLRPYQAARMASQTDQEPFFNSFTINQKTGMVKLEMPQGALSEVMGQLTDLKTMRAAAMARVAQLKQQESSGSPILDILSQLAGGMAANDPTMPGWVRALGQTSLAMGPQGIKRERATEEAKVMGLTKELADTSLQMAKLQDDTEQRVRVQIESMRKGAEKVEKDKTDTLIKLRKEGRAQIMASNEYDADGARDELRSVGLPEDQIDAQIASLDTFAAERRKYTKAQEDAKDENARKKADADLDKWEKAQDRIDARATQRAQNTFGWNVMKMSVPSNTDVSLAKNTSSLLMLLDKADAYLGKVPARYRGGPISGFFKEKNPWRDSKDQEAFQTAYRLNLSALEASGLKPISEIEFKKSMEQMFNPRNTWAQNKKIIEGLRQQVIKGTGDYLQMNRHRDWTPVAPLLPPVLQQMLPDLERRRREMYFDAAPQLFAGVTEGGQITLPTKPGESITLPGGVVLTAR